MTCPFCDRNSLNSPVLFEDEYIYVALSNPRLVPGHTLVIPKRHVLEGYELSEQERNRLFEVAIKLQHFLAQRIAGGCDVRTHFRPFIKQDQVKVDHVHVHVQPRLPKDELWAESQRFEREKVFRALPKEEQEWFAQVLQEFNP